MLSQRTKLICLPLFAAATLLGAASNRVRLAPKFVSGQTIRYRIDSSSKSTGKTTSPIVDPEGGSQSSDSVHMVVRLEVLGVSQDGNVRLRATYERSTAESEADALDLAAGSFSGRYKRLEGRTFEFTLGPGAAITHVQDLTAAAAGQSPKTIEPALTWLLFVVSSSSLPKDGVVAGQKWRIERPIEGAVLAGLVWRGQSTYLRSEPCGSSSRADSPTTDSDGCAVILTRFEITRSGRSDATPEDYRRNGLRTSGTWTGSGESLDSYSLSTGLLVSSTQTSSQQMDYQVVSASAGSSVHHIGKIESQSQITLVSSP